MEIRRSYAYAEFDSIDNKDQYRLMDMSARSGNRDGAALRYAAERLLTRPEAIRLLIVISDGQPAADNYYGTEAEADLRGIVDVGIGSDGCDPQLVLEFQQCPAVLVDSDLVGDVVCIRVHTDTFFLL